MAVGEHAAALVEVNAETDFVVRSPKFQVCPVPLCGRRRLLTASRVVSGHSTHCSKRCPRPRPEGYGRGFEVGPPQLRACTSCQIAPSHVATCVAAALWRMFRFTRCWYVVEGLAVYRHTADSSRASQSLPASGGGSISDAVAAVAAEVRENVKLRRAAWCVLPALNTPRY